MRALLTPIAATLLALASITMPAGAAEPLAPPAAMTATPDPETARIHDLLNAYTRCVSTGDRDGFERLLLDTQIPFYGVRDGAVPADLGGLAAVQRYAGFRASVFESGRQYAQTFHDIHIQRDRDLAQVSLRFETRLVGQAGGAQGWKVLQLLKVRGDWKIASEFYTADSL